MTPTDFFSLALQYNNNYAVNGDFRINAKKIQNKYNTQHRQNKIYGIYYT